MKRQEKMYKILEKMVSSALAGKEREVILLNSSYESLVLETEPENKEPWEFDYDACRQSCFMSVGNTSMRERFLSDLEERFYALPNPLKRNTR